MKKFAAFIAVVALLAFAAPAFSLTNPFMDVPMNSWAYDAVAQLASKGILSGYPDGLYRGRQPMTRYEAASVIARALAYTDMTKASRQDVAMLQRLVVEFKDELDALGVRVDALDRDVGLLRRRLGGWQITGRLRFDIDHRMADDFNGHGDTHPGSMGNTGLGDARIDFRRFFGENDQALFHMQVRSQATAIESGMGTGGHTLQVHHFYARIPFYGGSFLSAGWMGDVTGAGAAADRRFFFAPDRHARYEGTGFFAYNRRPMIGIERAFQHGNFAARISHPSVPGTGFAASDAWEVLGNFDFRVSNEFSFGIGGQFLSQDDWRIADDALMWDRVFTGWFGIDFRFMQGAALHGIVYFQSKSGPDGSPMDESANAWRVALNLGQDVLQFTSLWAEFGSIGQHFWSLEPQQGNMFVTGSMDPYGANTIFNFGNMAADDITYWKLGAAQNWTDRIRTWLFFVHASGNAVGNDGNVRQYGIGIDYLYNSYTTFGLNYMRWEGRDGGGREGIDGREFSRIRVTTEVRF